LEYTRDRIVVEKLWKHRPKQRNLRSSEIDLPYSHPPEQSYKTTCAAKHATKNAQHRFAGLILLASGCIEAHHLARIKTVFRLDHFELAGTYRLANNFAVSKHILGTLVDIFLDG